MSEKKNKKQKLNAAAAAAAATPTAVVTPAAKQRTMSRMNPNQKEAIIVFMETQSELLGAAVSKLHPREVVERLWGELTTQLNELGSVPKLTSTWKKTWFDMKREVKAKLGPPPYPPHLCALPEDQSMAGQRGRIAALMTLAVRICQQHAASSLQDAALGEDEEDSRCGDSADEANRASSPPVEISVKCEPPDFAEYDVDGAQGSSSCTSTPRAQVNGSRDEEGDVAEVPPAKRPRNEEECNTPEAAVRQVPPRPQAAAADAAMLQQATFAAALQMLAASQDRNALAMEGMAEAARGLSEVFRRRTAVEIEKVEALKQIACAIRSRPF